jgi:NADH dehydrogenase [ubiquinone] 1 alpha subcomplex assembly factor 7
MTPLENLLKKRIAEEGPLSLETFQQEALFHPQYGYYRTQKVLGDRGDFITAPEVSGLFGDVLGAFVLNEWDTTLGRPSCVSLIELGPGKGTLMGDVLRVGQLRPAFLEAAHVTLLEINPFLKATQKDHLSSYPLIVHWIDTLEVLPENSGPLILLANEFFDVLPIQQWVQDPKTPEGPWIERKVSLKEDRLCLIPDGEDLKIQEKSPQREALFLKLLDLLKKRGGLLWITDYGYEGPSSGDTLQGLYQRTPSPLLNYVGLTDLSSHVDFGRLATLAKDFSCEGPLTQGAFLKNNGLDLRLDALRRGASLTERARLEAAYMRLVHPLQMGTLFKTLVIRP